MPTELEEDDDLIEIISLIPDRAQPEINDERPVDVHCEGNTVGETPEDTGPFAGGSSNRFGCRPMVVSAGIIATVAIMLTSFATSLEWVYITYGLILAALTFMYILTIVIVGQYFTKRHALANGMVALPPLYQMLIETYGWRSALIVISVHFVPNAVSENIKTLDAAFLMSIMGITSIVGRSLHGWFVDLGYFCPATVLAVSLSGAGVCFVGMPLSNGSYAILATVAAGFGFCMGVAMPLSSVTLKVCIGIEHLPNALGWFVLFNGFGNMMGALFAGWLYDMTSNYNVAFIMASLCMIIAGCILFTKLGC
ncbi:monocarboxylate transporter 13-like [Saccoglossus kowalevskii]